MNTTTTIPVPPARWFTGPDLERIAAQNNIAAQPFTNIATDVDPDQARRTCEQIQAASRQAARDGIDYAPTSPQGRRVRKFWEAANCFSVAAQLGPDDDMGRFAQRMAREVRAYIADFVPVPQRSAIGPEVPGVGKEANGG